MSAEIERAARILVNALREVGPCDAMSSAFVHADRPDLTAVIVDGCWNMQHVADRVLKLLAHRSKNTNALPDFVETMPWAVNQDANTMLAAGELAQDWKAQGCTFTETTHTGAEIVILGWKLRPADYGLEGGNDGKQ